MNELTKECLAELGKTLDEVGEYDFDDYTSAETCDLMDVVSLARKFRELSESKAIEILIELSHTTEYDNRGLKVAQAIIYQFWWCGFAKWPEIEDRPELEEILRRW